MNDSPKLRPQHRQPKAIIQIQKVSPTEPLLSWRPSPPMARMPDASVVGRIRGRCGDSMEIYLKIKEDRIRKASFYTDGCGSSVACGAVAAQLATGKSIDEAALIGGDTILEVVNGLPEKECHCAYLAAETLQAAIHDWMVRQRVGTTKP
jgi:nitrogen fixation protein NifU and related proteins